MPLWACQCWFLSRAAQGVFIYSADSLHCSCAPSGGGYTPSSSWKHLNGGRDYSSHDQLAPARYIHLWCPSRGLVSLCLPWSPLTVKEQRPPPDCGRMLHRVIDIAVVPPLVAWFSCTKLSYCALSKQKSWTRVYAHMLFSLWGCLPRYFAIVLKAYSWLDIRRTSTKFPSSHNIQSHTV